MKVTLQETELAHNKSKSQTMRYLYNIQFFLTRMPNLYE